MLEHWNGHSVLLLELSLGSMLPRQWEGKLNQELFGGFERRRAQSCDSRMPDEELAGSCQMP